MGALVGLGVGIGLMLVWSAFFLPRGTRPTRGPGRVRRGLVLAGLGGVSTAGFVVLCLVLGLAAGLLVQLVSRTPPVAICFATSAVCRCGNTRTPVMSWMRCVSPAR